MNEDKNHRKIKDNKHKINTFWYEHFFKDDIFSKIPQLILLLFFSVKLMWILRKFRP